MLLMLAFATEAFAWKPILIGHRGSSSGVENTEQAFINGAKIHGCQALECDVKVTSDKQYVCWHDDIITLAGNNCTIYTNTLAKVQSLTLRQTNNGVTYTGKICTVDRYLEICKQYDVIPVIELKAASGIYYSDMSNFPGLYALIEKHGLVDKAIILTSMQESLQYVRKNYPKLKCQYLVYYITTDRINWCKNNGCDLSTCFYYTSSNYVTQALMTQAHNAGLKVSLWTMNSLSDYKKYAAYGANYITSDDFVYSELPELSGTDPNPSQADVTWVLNGGTVSGTLPTVITSTYTIPTPTRTGYVFLGWYSTNSTSGTKYTTLSAGFKGTIYAVWRETKVTWVLNGGKVYEEKAAVPTQEELWASYKTAAGLTTLGTLAEIQEAGAGQPHNSGDTPCACRIICAKLTATGVQAAFGKSEWTWLKTYIMGVQSDLTDDLTAANWRYAIAAFFLQSQHTAWPASADFTTAGKPTAWASAYQAAHGNASGGATELVEVTLPTRFSSTYTIPTPVKEGYDFVGWYNNADGTGTALKTLPAYYDGTVYAIWKIQDDVKWELHGGYIVGVTLPGRISDAPYTIPTPSRNMHVFLGWYDNEAGTGTPLTVLPVGYKGTVHATWREAKVTWVLNGGKVMKDGAEVTLPTSIKSAYTIPTPEKEGHTFLGWYDTNDTTGTQYTRLTAGHDGTLYAIWEVAIPTDVKWVLDGGKVDGELPTEITGSPYTIPTPTRTGYVFLGWYDNAEGTGTAITVLPVGYKGTLYALWREAKVTWVLNGGKVLKEVTTTVPGTSGVTVPTQEVLWENFKTAGGITTLGTLAEIKEAGAGKAHNDPSNPCACRTICGKLTATVLQAIFAKAEWKWLMTYVMNTQNAQTDAGAVALTEDLSLAEWRYAVAAFFLQAQHEAYPKSANFATAGQPSAWGPAYQAANGGAGTDTETKTEWVEVELPSKITGAPYEIPTPVKDGDEFIGWYDNEKGTGTSLTILPVDYDGTVYAIWKSMGTSTSVENVRPELNTNEPMYDILGRRVDATYRGIIIQNGNKYLLR